MPDVRFSFEPSDIVNRVMSIGASTPIEVSVSGPNLEASRTFAQTIKERLRLEAVFIRLGEAYVGDLDFAGFGQEGELDPARAGIGRLDVIPP